MIWTAALVAASLAVAHSQPAQSPPAQQPSEQGQPGGQRPHQIGIGGSLVVSNQGASGGFRYFFGQRLGVNVSAGWSSSVGRYSAGTSSAVISPSVMYMLTLPNDLRELDIRPYVGGGATYVHANYATSRAGPGVTGAHNDWGMQAFGGAEMSFRSAKAVTISVEGIYYNVPSTYTSTSNFSGFDWLVAFHYYVK